MNHEVGSEVGGAGASPKGERGAEPVGDRLARWMHTLDSLAGASEGPDLERRWVRVSAIRSALRGIEARAIGPDLDRELVRVRAAVESTAELLQVKLRPEVSADLARWLELASARRAIDQRLHAARAGLAGAIGTRSRHARAHFALGMPVAVEATRAIADAASNLGAARAAIGVVDERLAAVRAGCPPEPPVSYPQALSDVKGAAPREFAEIERSLAPDLEGAARAGDQARRVLVATPTAGGGPAFTGVEELPMYLVLRAAPWVLFGAGLLLALVALFQLGPAELVLSVGTSQATILGCVGAALALWGALRITDRVLTRRFVAWEQLAKPIDRARIVVFWHYLVGRKAVEQLEDERAALVELEAVWLAMDEFDASPNRGLRLTALRADRPDLAVQVDLAAQDLGPQPASAARAR